MNLSWGYAGKVFRTVKRQNLLLFPAHKTSNSTYIADYSHFCHRMQDSEPDTDVLCSVSHRSSEVAHDLIRVNSDLEDVVGKSEERSQRKCSHEDGDEAKLNHCGKENDFS